MASFMKAGSVPKQLALDKLKSEILSLELQIKTLEAPDEDEQECYLEALYWNTDAPGGTEEKEA